MLTRYPGLRISNSNFSLVLSHTQPSKVILSVPHDCLVSGDCAGLFQERQSGIKVRDLYVWAITNDIVRHSRELGTRVDAVRFLMPRTYVDANRSLSQEENLDPKAHAQTALDDQRLTSLYRYYHGEIQRLLERSIQKFGTDKVLLVDLHGFGNQPAMAPPQGYDLILGTANRTTLHYGNVDVAFAAFMRQRSYEVFLPGKQPIGFVWDPFDAGQTVRWYAKRYGINAMQIEIASIFRHKDKEGIKGKMLAKDIAAFLSDTYG